MVQTIIPLPLIERERNVRLPLPTQGNGDHELPPVKWVERVGPLLHPTPLAGSEDVLGLYLGRGCLSRCAFCSVRGSSRYPVDESVQAYRDLAGRLALELARLPNLPRAVFLSPAMDPFPAVAALQEETLRVVEMLAGHGIESWLMTRGEILPGVLQGLARSRDRVKVTVPLTTLDTTIAQITEPATALPSARLHQVGELNRLGIPVQVALDPLLPTLTDTRENLGPLLAGLAETGVRQVTASYLFLREGIEEELRKALGPHGWAEQVVQAFRGGPILTAAGLAPARYLPRPRRQRGYALLMTLAASQGIAVTISRLTNPDFAAPKPTAAGPRPRLVDLFRTLRKNTPQ
jgi:DNA repair photolyase